MNLHQDNAEFRAAVDRAIKETGLESHIIEKDYWVTKTLLNLHQHPYKEYVVFKGGTALSKGHKIIESFSEDIDLALHPDGIGIGKIDKREGKALLKVVRAIKDQEFTDEEEGKGSEGKRYKRVYSFPTSFTYPKDSPVHDKIVLEVNSFSVPTPTVEVEIQSILGASIGKLFGEEVLIELNMLPFKVNALSVERVFCEKLLALRRASHRGGDFFAERIRHVYDIHYLFNSKKIQSWVSNLEEVTLMLNMAHADDELNQKISKEVSPSLYAFEIYNSPMDNLKSVKSAYENLKSITYSKTIPSLEEVAHSLSGISDLLKGHVFE